MGENSVISRRAAASMRGNLMPTDYTDDTDSMSDEMRLFTGSAIERKRSR
jgi:hypothetical protein